MANTQQTIDIIFNGIDRTAGAISSVIDNVERGVNRVGDIAKPIANVTTGLLKFEAAILAAGAATTLLAIKTAGDFESAFSEIATLIDQPKAALQGFRQEILDYAAGSSQGLDKITGALYGAISAGVDYTDALGVVGTAEKLAVASKADLSETLVLLVSSLNAYGKSADSAQGFSDALFQTVKLGQTTLPELASSLAQVTGLAASAGVPFETLLSAVAALTAAGLPTSQAITGIKAALSNIIKPTKDASDLAAELGIKFDASALSSKGFEGVLQDVYKATGGNVDQMARMFGSVEGLNAVLSLASNGGERFAEAMAAMGNAAGSTEEAFGKMSDNVSLGTQKIQNAIKVTLIAIGDPLLDEFGSVQNAIAGIFQAIGESVSKGSLQQFVATIETMAKDLESVFSAVAKNLPAALAAADYSGFLNSLEIVRQTVRDLFGNAVLTSAEGLQRIIEAVGRAFETLTRFSGDALKVAKPLAEALADILHWLSQLDPETIKTAASIGIMAKAFTLLAPAITTSGSAVKLLLSAFQLLAANPLVAAILAGGAIVTVIFKAIEAYGDKLEEQYKKESAQRQEEIRQAAELQVAQHGLASARDNLSAAVEKGSRAAQVMLADMDRLNQETEEGQRVTENTTEAWLQGASSLQEYYGRMGVILDASGNLVGALTDTATALTKQKNAAVENLAAWYEMQGNSPEIARRMAELEQPVAKVEKALEDATKKTESFMLKMEEIASNERIKGMEVFRDINVAAIEADTKRIEAAFKSVTETIGTLNTGLVDMVGLFAGLDSDDSAYLSKKWALEKQIDKQNDRLDQQLELQTKLTEAQIDNMRARTEALKEGGALIKIESEGLEPALEMVMWHVLEKVQIRVNEEAAEFLIGLNTGTV